MANDQVQQAGQQPGQQPSQTSAQQPGAAPSAAPDQAQGQQDGQQPGDFDGLEGKKPEELTPEELRLMADTMPGEGPGD